MNEQRIHTNWQQKGFTKLLGLQYRVVYKKGVENSAADALSHRLRDCPNHDQCFAISFGQPKWIEEVTSTYERDSVTQEIIAKLVLDSVAVPNFSWMDGVLHYKSRIWIGIDSSMHQKLISTVHNSALGVT
jgi:hypothetical protein